MIEKFIQQRIRQALPFPPNEGQQQLLALLAQFIIDSDRPQSNQEVSVASAHRERKAFILRGYAGTGKTSIMAALVRAMSELKQSVVLLAPTGRAAKVLARYAGQPAYTIHKCIYRQRQLGVEDFALADNLKKHTLFIVDEASMISGQRDGSSFGTGMLLDDLVKYVYSGEGCRLLLLGDDAQLPPVGSSLSPALDAQYMAGYGLQVTTYALTQVARQALDSGILRNATYLREQLEAGGTTEENWVLGEDFRCVTGADFLEALERAYREVGEEEVLILTRTNRRTNLYNQGIRSRILWKEDEVSTGDRLMVSKNNYFWSRQYDNLPFLANGDMPEIVRLRNTREMYGYHFADASLRSLDYDWEIDVVLWLDTLQTDSPEANYELQKTLFSRIAEDYPELQRNRRRLTEEVYKSPYYNALQVRFAYAVTCHKAQGGQWKRVFIDPGNVPPEQRNTDYLRWLYTAVTRATECVYLLKNG